MSLNRWIHGFLGALAIGSIGATLWACGGYGDTHPVETQRLIAELGALAREPELDRQRSPQFASLIATLRGRRQGAFDAAMEYRSQRVKQLGGPDFAEIKNLDWAIDRIAGQKFASQSRLYWYTSMDVAKASAGNSVLDSRPLITAAELNRKARLNRTA